MVGDLPRFFFHNEVNAKPIHNYRCICILLSVSPVSLEVMILLIKHHFYFFSESHCSGLSMNFALSDIP